MDPLELEIRTKVADRLFRLATSDPQGAVPLARGSAPEAFTDGRADRLRRLQSRRLPPLSVAFFGTRVVWQSRGLALAVFGSRAV